MQGQELIDKETGEITKLPQKQEEKPKQGLLDFQDQITELIPLAGTIDLTEEQKKILYAPVNEEDVEIRPDGLIYLPWMEYVSRLKEAFGLSWAIIPQGQPKISANHIIWAFWLIIQGKPAAFAFGEQQYFPNNPTMTYGDALEGAKSNALMRVCKGIGISLELWRPSFIREWKAKHAESYRDAGKIKWRKKGACAQTGLNPEGEESKKQNSGQFQAKINFLEKMKTYPAKVGRAKYDEILYRNDVKKVEDITDSKQQEEILAELETAYQERIGQK